MLEMSKYKSCLKECIFKICALKIPINEVYGTCADDNKIIKFKERNNRKLNLVKTNKEISKTLPKPKET